MWCPKHRWEFTNPSFTSCPSCGSPLVHELPPNDEPPEPKPSTPARGDETATASRLGGFDRLAAPMLLDLLRERGIRAFEAPQPANPITRGFDPMHTDIWVESGRLDDARRVAEEELPAFIEQSLPDEPEPEPEPEPEESSGDQIEWSSFGWMETHVATAFLAMCEEEAISAHTEYPLDRPPPVWVTPGMRVQVYVDALFVEEAEQLLEPLERRLDEDGVEWVDPLCELSGP